MSLHCERGDHSLIMVSRFFRFSPLLLITRLHLTHALTLNLLTIFDVHLKSTKANCSDLNPEAVRHVGVLEHAVYQATLNETHVDLNVSVQVLDTCGDTEQTLQKLQDFVAHAKEHHQGEEQHVHGIIIDSSKDVASTVASFAFLFSIPVINVARIVEIDDVPSSSSESVVNMAPSRDDLADAITAFLKQKDVPYVQAMTSQTSYHRRFLEKFNERTSLRDCCVVTQFEISKNLTTKELDKILDGLLREAGFSPGTVMLTTEEDFVYLLEALARRGVHFGPLFIGLQRPADSWLIQYNIALTGATFFQNIIPAHVNATDFQAFVRSSLIGPDPNDTLERLNPLVICDYLPRDDCLNLLVNWTDLHDDFVSSYIQTAVQMLIEGASVVEQIQTPCSLDQLCLQKAFHGKITHRGECERGSLCVDENPIISASVFDVYSVTLGLQMIEAGRVEGIHSYVEWPPNSHLNEYWTIMNKVRIGFRAECRTKVRNKYARLNTDGADAYVIGVLHAHKEQTSPSGCDENGVHREHTLRTEAILYAVDRINERNDIIPNITLGAIIIDSCYITDKIVQQIVDIVNGHVKVKNHFGLLSVPVGMIGTSSSSRTTAVAPTIQSYNIPIVSFSASSPVLSDKYLYPLFFRPIASDVKQAQAMVDLLKNYGWTYFGCVFSSTSYGTHGIRELIQQAHYKGMRVAYQVQLDDTITNDEKGLDYVFRHFIMNRMERVRVVVAFLETRHAEAIFLTAERHNVTGLVWVGSDSFTDSDTAAKSRFALGSIGVVFHTGILEDFGRYIDSINARNYTRNPFYLDLVESTLECHLREEHRLRFPEPCPEDARLVYRDISTGGESSPTIDCVLALAYGLDFLIRRHCSEHAGKLCTEAKSNIGAIPSMMTEVIFNGSSGQMIMFDSKGDGVGRYDFINLQPPTKGDENEYVKFAAWDTGRLQLTSSPMVMSIEGQMVSVGDIKAFCDGNTCSSTSADLVGMEYAYKRGKLIIHAFIPVHFYDPSIGACSSKIDHSGFEAVVAALWAVDSINENGMLPETKLGIAVYDTCSNSDRARQMAQEVVKSTFVVPRPPDIPQKDTLIGLIGSTNDEETLAIAGQRLTDYSDKKVPLISMTSSILPKDLASDDTFFRTVPPTDAEIRLIIMLLKRLGWDYVHLVYSASLSKNATAKRFVADASSHDLCVATKVPLHSYWQGLQGYVNAVYHMLNVTGATGVVLMTNEYDTEQLLTAAKEIRAHGKLFWIATEAWRQTDWISDLYDIALGALTIAPNQTVNTNFGQYFTSLSIVNGSEIAWFQDYWQSYFNCNLARGELFEKTCTANLKLNSSGEYDQSWETPAIINAVYSYAHAVRSISHKCRTNQTQCNGTLVDYLDHVLITEELPHVNFAPPGGVNFYFRDRSGQGSFEVFNIQPYRGRYRFIQVGQYNNGELQLSMHHTGMYRDGRRLIPLSKCPGQCKVCLTDMFLAEYNALVESLRAAGPPLYHHLNRAIGIVMISLLCLGIGFTALLIFYLVKLASSRRVYLELSTDATVTLIVGVLLLYLSNITFLFSATNGTCAVRRVCLGIAYCLCFSGQLLDVARLALLLQLKPDAPAHDVLKAKRVHIYLPVLLAGQIVPTIFWLLLEPSGALLDVPPPQDVASLKEVLPTWRCKIDRYELVLSLVYDAVLLLHTMILAFITRHVTSGYGARPARSVLMSTVVSAIIWIAWIPLYLHLEDNDAYLALVSVGISLDATFMLGITFMPKVVTLMDQSADNPLRDVPWNPQPRYSYRKFTNIRRGSTEINERLDSRDGGLGQLSRQKQTVPVDRSSNVTSVIRVRDRGVGWQDRRGGSFRRILPLSPGKSALIAKRAKFKEERPEESSFESSEGIYC